MCPWGNNHRRRDNVPSRVKRIALVEFFFLVSCCLSLTVRPCLSFTSIYTVYRGVIPWRGPDGTNPSRRCRRWDPLPFLYPRILRIGPGAPRLTESPTRWAWKLAKFAKNIDKDDKDEEEETDSGGGNDDNEELLLAANKEETQSDEEEELIPLAKSLEDADKEITEKYVPEEEEEGVKDEHILAAADDDRVALAETSVDVDKKDDEEKKEIGDEDAGSVGVKSERQDEENIDEEDDDEDDEDDDDWILSSVTCPSSPTSPWKLPNDFETFLNQCSIQSFVFLLKSLRDPQTVLWIERFTKPTIRAVDKPKKTKAHKDGSDFSDAQDVAKQVGGTAKSKLLNYHGLGAINTTDSAFPTWETFFEKLLDQPKEVFSVDSYNPHFPSYDMEINPASLCSRIISVREQIAREFVKDLTVISSMGGFTMDSYWDRLRRERDAKGESGDGMVRPDRQNLIFLENNAVDEDSGDAPSPLRKGNFDLLVLLTTQESIHRILNDPKRQQGAERASNEFLQNFYIQRLASHFVGSKWYGRADDFLEELFLEPPKMVQVPSRSTDDDADKSEDGTTALIDPLRIAELLLNTRSQVALDWKGLAESAPEKHMHIKRMQLNILMGIHRDGKEDDDNGEVNAVVKKTQADSEEDPHGEVEGEFL